MAPPPESQAKELREQISAIEAQENTLILAFLNNDVAFELGSQIRTNFLSQFDPARDGIVISISLFSGHQLFGCAVGNPKKLGPDNWDWVRRKTNTVKRYGLSSWLVGRQRLLKGKDLDGLGPDYAAHGGAFPIFIQGMNAGPIGAVVVSGLTQEKDHELVTTAISQIIKQQSSS